MNEHERHEADEGQATARLMDELKALYNQPVLVPPRVDETVLALARDHLAGVTRRSRRVVPFPRWLAAAAAVALGVWLANVWHVRRSGPVFAREDINRDGRVDVLDAFALARQIQQRQVVDDRFDINGDGIVDRRDIDAVAARAVKLEKGEG